jgi:hypothetical protein
MLVINQSFVTAQMVLAIILADKKSQDISGDIYPIRSNTGIGVQITTKGVDIIISEAWSSNDIMLYIKVADHTVAHNFERDFDKAAFYTLNQLSKYNLK